MIPSRGLRWSTQTIGIGRRRLEPFCARQFSSSYVQNVSIRPKSLVPNNNTSISRTHTRPQFPKSNLLIRNGAGIRFASTTPVAASPAPVDAIGSAGPPPPQVVTSSLDKATDFATDSFLNVPEHIGYLKYLGLDYGWGPTAMMEWLLEHVHVYAGTPWWVSIVLTTVLVRAVLFKAYMGASDNAAKMAAIRPMMEPLTKELTSARVNGDKDRAMQLQQEVQLINKRAGIKLSRSFIPLLQVFTGYGMWVCLRGMSNLPVPGLESGGILWFHNLTLADPYLIMPAATALVLHWVLRKGGETGASTMSPTATKIFRIVLPAFSFIFTWWLPAAVQVSFLTTGIMSYFQMELFKNDKFRARFDMYPLKAPPSPASKPSPYKGTINVRARQGPLTQEELNNTYNKPSATENAELQAGKQALSTTKPPGTLKKIVGGAFNDVKGTFKSVKESASEVVDMSKGKMSERKKKADRDAVLQYEQKRQEELRRERWELENQRRAERAAKKLEKRSR